MMVAKAELPDGMSGYGPEKVEELRSRVDLLTELDLGGVAAECGALGHLVAGEENEPIPGREGWVETSYRLVAGGAEEVREYLVRAIDEVVGERPHPNVSYEGFGGRTYAVSGGVSGGDDPTIGRDGSEAYGWVQALGASGVLEKPSGTAPEEIEGVLDRAREAAGAGRLRCELSLVHGYLVLGDGDREIAWWGRRQLDAEPALLGRVLGAVQKLCGDSAYHEQGGGFD